MGDRRKNECRRFRDTGTCRFGSRCKYSHAIDRPDVVQELFSRLDLDSRPSRDVKVGLGDEQRKDLRQFLKSYIPNEQRGIIKQADSEGSSSASSDNEETLQRAMKDENEVQVEEMYKHIPDSKFKRDFLENIKGNFRASRGLSSEVKCNLERNPMLDFQLKSNLCDKIQKSEQYKKIFEFRRTLPVYGSRQLILNFIEEHQILVISGETGCGKTTQVAQFILDDWIMNDRGSLCHIICTQPRRISTVSVAERVAYERLELCGEDCSVGYQIRLEKKLPRKQGSILFCTTGILQQLLQSDPGLTHVTHIIIDEIHERNVDSDFVMTVLREILPQRRDLKLILMSATINAQVFSEYLNNCAVVEIPGKLFDVRVFYLEDVLSLTGYVREGLTQNKYPRTLPRGCNTFSDLIVPYALSLRGKYGDLVIQQILHPRSEHTDLDLIQHLIEYLCLKKGPGAILVFLSGWETISKLCQKLTNSKFFCLPGNTDEQESSRNNEEQDEDEQENDPEAVENDVKILQGHSGRYMIFPLHSRMSSVYQSQVFNPPPPGVRKIIVSTNIAEISITINDVVYVIDSGKMKVKNYDIDNNICTLKDEWVSKASAKQRRGRAGRVQPGECYCLFTKAHERTFEEFPVPEILRIPLVDLIMDVKILQLGKVNNILRNVMNSPDQRTVMSSIKLLQTLRALDNDENLTPLGFHLSKLPLEPHIGKMILFSAIFSCIDPILTIAACLAFREPFVLPPNRDKEVIDNRIKLSEGRKSDHLVLAEIFGQWEATSRKKSYKFCRKNFLSLFTLQSLRDFKSEFAQHLHEMGFLKSNNPKDVDANVNSKNMSLLKAIICAGLYPNVAIVQRIERYKISGKTEVVIKTPEDGLVKLHRTSVNESQTKFESPYLMYHTKLKSSHIFLHDTTMVSSLPLILFSHKVQHDKDSGVIVVNREIKFHCDKDLANIVQELRQEVQKVLDKLIIQPGTIDWNSNNQDTQILRAAVTLMTEEDDGLVLSKK